MIDWSPLTALLQQMASGTLSVEDYQARLRGAERGTVWETYREYVPFDLSTPLQYIPLTYVLLAAAGEVAPPESEEGDPTLAAGAILADIMDQFIESKRPFTRRLDLLGVLRNGRVFTGEVEKPAGTQTVLCLAERIQQAETGCLDYTSVMELCAAYNLLRPDTLLGCLCLALVHDLLPWLAQGDTSPEAVHFHAGAGFQIGSGSLCRLRWWLSALRGEIPLDVTLSLHSGQTCLILNIPQ